MLLLWLCHVDTNILQTEHTYTVATHTRTHLHNRPKWRQVVTWRLIPSSTHCWFKGLNKSRAAVADTVVDLIQTDKPALSNLLSLSGTISLYLSLYQPVLLSLISSQRIRFKSRLKSFFTGASNISSSWPMTFRIPHCRSHPSSLFEGSY